MELQKACPVEEATNLVLALHEESSCVRRTASGFKVQAPDTSDILELPSVASGLEKSLLPSYRIRSGYVQFSATNSEFSMSTPLQKTHSSCKFLRTRMLIDL